MFSINSSLPHLSFVFSVKLKPLIMEPLSLLIIVRIRYFNKWRRHRKTFVKSRKCFQFQQIVTDVTHMLIHSYIFSYYMLLNQAMWHMLIHSYTFFYYIFFNHVRSIRIFEAKTMIYLLQNNSLISWLKSFWYLFMSFLISMVFFCCFISIVINN